MNWRGYSPEDSTWQSAASCAGSKRLVQEYHDRAERMITYKANGDTSEFDYLTMAAISTDEQRFDDYAYQIRKVDDYTIYDAMNFGHDYRWRTSAWREDSRAATAATD